MRRIAAGALVAGLVLAGCSSSGDDTTATTTTVGPTTTLLAPATTTTLPPRAVTEVDACALLTEVELDTVLDDAGAGEPTPPLVELDDGGGVPPYVTAECSWPSRADPQLVLHYLAPTTAADGVGHLEDVLAQGTGFAEGGRVVPQQVGNQTVGVLLDAEDRVVELAVVKRSALLYLLVNQEVDGRDPEALTAYGRALLAALVRAPR